MTAELVSLSDSELLAAYAAGSEEAFGEVARRHGTMVWRAARRVLGDEHEAEDAAQAAFLVLARRSRSFRRGGDLAGWLHGIAARTALEARRSRAARRGREEEAAMTRREVSGGAEIAEQAEALGRLDKELARLPALQRQAVVLRHLEGRSQEEAARLAGCPVGTLSRRAADGLGRLRERLARRGGSLSGVALAGLLGAEASGAVPETLLPSILAVPKLAAAGAAAGAVGGGLAVTLAEGVLKAMFWTKVKLAAAVMVAVTVVLAAIPVTVHVIEAAEEAKNPEAFAQAPAAPAAEPAQPQARAGFRIWEPLTDSGVSYSGTFTPDGRHFVYLLLPAKGAAVSELRAVEVATGRQRSLGGVPLDPAALSGAAGKAEPVTLGGGGPGDRRLWLAVEAATNDLETVFLNQKLLRRREDQYLVWRTGEKALVALNANLLGADCLGSSADGGTLAFRLSRSPLRLCVFDAATGQVGKPFEAGIAPDLCYRTEAFWAGNELFGFVARGGGQDRKPEGTEVLTLWPKCESLGVLTATTRTLRTGAGVVEPVACHPLFCGSPGGKGGKLVFLRGDEVLAADRGARLETVGLCAVPTSEVPDRHRLPATADAADERVYTSWLEVTSRGGVDFNDYLRAEKALGTERKVTLRLAVSSTGGTKPDGDPLDFDITALFDRLRQRALEEYRASKAPKSDSGVLTRQPWVSALGARDGRVILLLGLRVWYGICGADYSWLLAVDCRERSLAHARDFAGSFGGGLRSGPPGLTHRVSPRGDALAVIREGNLLLFRTAAGAGAAAPDHAEKQALLARGGGSAATLWSEEAGVPWLVRVQEPDGHWNSAKYGARPADDVAATAAATLSMLGAGYTDRTGKYQDNVQRALGWLSAWEEKLPERERAALAPRAAMLASLALSEAHAMSGFGTAEQAARWRKQGERWPDPGRLAEADRTRFGPSCALWLETVAAFGRGGTEWRGFNERMKKELILSQERGSAEAGSWPGREEESDRNEGRVLTTALSVMCLEVYYRYLPVLREGQRPGPTPPGEVF